MEMTKKQFREWAFEKVRILDGATGTLLQKNGMPPGVCPEKWVLENPNSILQAQREYVKCGSDIIYTFTFGGNGLKLKEFGIDTVVQYNRELARLSKQAAGGNALVAGDISSTGQLMEPYGEYTFEEIVNIYKEQVKGLLEGGVDLFAIETIMDIQEARAALLAVMESCDLPVIVTMTFEKGGRTINGTDPLTALVALQSLGADAVGCNCSTGPKEMLGIIREIKPYARVPLVAKPNAGLPKLVNGNTVFEMNAAEFAEYTGEFIDAGVNLTGGCCGTSPEFIDKVSKKAKEQGCRNIAPEEGVLLLSSSRKTVHVGTRYPICVIGDRIDPARDEKLREELRQGSLELATEYAIDQSEEGVLVLGVKAGAEGIDEVNVLHEMVKTLCSMVQTPLCIDSSSPEALDSALRIYPGRALISFVSAGKGRLEKILPVAAKYGSAFVLLPADDSGVPEKAGDMIEIAEKVYDEARKYGYSKDDILTENATKHF